jgi:hypothetical protein
MRHNKSAKRSKRKGRRRRGSASKRIEACAMSSALDLASTHPF